MDCDGAKMAGLAGAAAAALDCAEVANAGTRVLMVMATRQLVWLVMVLAMPLESALKSKMEAGNGYGAVRAAVCINGRESPCSPVVTAVVRATRRLMLDVVTESSKRFAVQTSKAISPG